MKTRRPSEANIIAVTPYVMARTSHHFFSMSHAYATEREVPFARHYLYCASIEIGLKASILADECSEERKRTIREFGHDLLRCLAAFEEIYRANIWNTEDINTVASINPFFVRKGLEYFTIDVLVDTVSGPTSRIPSIDLVGAAAQKVNQFIVQRSFFL